MAIRTIFWDNDAVVMIDQKALPGNERYIRCVRYEDVIDAIRDLTIRGAPAIGVAAAMGVALGMLQRTESLQDELASAFYRICREFAATRPTARNLFWALERMERHFVEVSASDPEHIKKVLIAEAVRICEDDIAVNRRIGLNGRCFIADGSRILTHCNAGALATAGYGTALGVVRAAWEEGKKVHVFVGETRPVLQGARLTAWELVRENIPATLITDSMAGALMQRGRIDLVITGSDRIARNGDAANKIGTYSLAVLANAHRIPFYIAAPLSTIDLSVPCGNDIPIEERSSEEVTHCGGIRIAPDEIGVYNPAFDVTPGSYITAIITEAGIALPPYEESIPPLFGEGYARAAAKRTEGDPE
jgi:methylthioribose-1-phosphate isomerase